MSLTQNVKYCYTLAKSGNGALNPITYNLQDARI